MISVIIPVYNREELIKRAIESVLIQKGDLNLEIIVVDDMSTDNTESVVKSFEDKRIRYFKTDKNVGPAGARNIGIKASLGEYIAFLDSDDEFLPEKLSRQKQILDDQQMNVDMVISNYCVNERTSFGKIDKKIKSGKVSVERAFPASVFTPPSNWMIKKGVFTQVGLMDENLRGNEDADFYARVARKVNVFFLNENLTIMYVHDSLEGRDMDSVAISIREYLLEKWLPEMKKDKEYLCDFYYCAGKHLVRVKQYREAIPWLWKAIKVRPLEKRIYGKLIKALISTGRNEK